MVLSYELLMAWKPHEILICGVSDVSMGQLDRFIAHCSCPGLSVTGSLLVNQSPPLTMKKPEQTQTGVTPLN